MEKPDATPRNARSLVPKVTLKERVMAKRRAKARVKMLMGLLRSQRASRTEAQVRAKSAGRNRQLEDNLNKWRSWSNPSMSHYAWLVDSGATCHLYALSLYEVVREHSGPLPTLLSASDTAVECLKVVDIRVKFGKLNPVILQDVLVCKIGFNVVSPWQALMNGWDTFLTQGFDSCLSKVTSKGTIHFPLFGKQGAGGSLRRLVLQLRQKLRRNLELRSGSILMLWKLTS